MNDMETLEQKFEELSKHIPEYESDIWGAIDSLEKASSSAVEKGQKKLEVAIARLNEVDELITSAFSMSHLSSKANARLHQCLVSVRPRLNSYVEQLKNLIENPPTESKYTEIDNMEIFSSEESQYSDSSNDDNEQNVGNIIDQNGNENNQSNVSNEQIESNGNQKIDNIEKNDDNNIDQNNINNYKSDKSTENQEV